MTLWCVKFCAEAMLKDCVNSSCGKLIDTEKLKETGENSSVVSYPKPWTEECCGCNGCLVTRKKVKRLTTYMDKFEA